MGRRTVVTDSAMESIESMGNQIDYFKTKYRVVIADNEGR
jgi:hypothetical protein